MEDAQTRGVANARVVDLIRPDEATGEVVLVMLEERPWEDGEAQLHELEAKFNAYIEYVLGGHFVRQYPEYAERPVRFQLDCRENPRPEQQSFFTAMTNYAAAEDIRLVVSVA